MPATSSISCICGNASSRLNSNPTALQYIIRPRIDHCGWQDSVLRQVRSGRFSQPNDRPSHHDSSPTILRSSSVQGTISQLLRSPSWCLSQLSQGVLFRRDCCRHQGAVGHQRFPDRVGVHTPPSLPLFILCYFFSFFVEVSLYLP